MKLLACSVFDAAIGSYGRPFFVQTKGVAVRSFMDEVGRPSDPSAPNTLSAHPDDFALFAVGFFDEETGQFESLPVPERLMQARDVLNKD